MAAKKRASGKDNVARALGRIPSGCCILTARDGDESNAILASWVQQAGFKPPAVTVAVKHGRPIQKLIDTSKRFVLNIVGEDATPLFRHFGKGFAPGKPAFKGLAVRVEKEGVILEEAIGYLVCKVKGRVETGDHTIYVGEVTGGNAGAGAKPHVHLRASGLKY